MKQVLGGQLRTKVDRMRDKIMMYIIQGVQPGDKLPTAQVQGPSREQDWRAAHLQHRLGFHQALGQWVHEAGKGN